LGAFAPQAAETTFQEWWRRILSMVNISNKKSINSLIILGAWTLWRHHNDCVFNGLAPRLATTLVMAGEHINALNMVGAKGHAMISELGWGRLEG
jgi:hypothetical protein